MESAPLLRGQSRAARPSQKASRDLPVLVALPWLVFTVVVCLFSYLYHHQPSLCWGLVGAAAVASFAAQATYREGEGGSANLSLIGLLSLFAVGFGSAVGLYNYEAHMAPYFSYDSSRAYTNVLPSEPAGAFADAGKIIFARQAKVDTAQSVGYKHGETYCVAPVTDPTSGSRVEFWAVCLNACGSRRDFRCDSAGDPSAHGAIAVRDHGFLLPGKMDFYKRAVREAEAAFDLVSSSEPLFVRWIADPDAYQEQSLSKGTTNVITAALAYFAVNGVFAWQAYAMRKY